MCTIASELLTHRALDVAREDGQDLADHLVVLLGRVGLDFESAAARRRRRRRPLRRRVVCERRVAAARHGQLLGRDHHHGRGHPRVVVEDRAAAVDRDCAREVARERVLCRAREHWRLSWRRSWRMRRRDVGE